MVIEVEIWSSGRPGEQGAHVDQRVDGDPHLADLAPSHRVVGVVTHLGRQIERDTDPATARRD